MSPIQKELGCVKKVIIWTTDLWYLNFVHRENMTGRQRGENIARINSKEEQIVDFKMENPHRSKADTPKDWIRRG